MASAAYEATRAAANRMLAEQRATEMQQQRAANSAQANGIQTRGGRRDAHPLDFWRLRDKAVDKGVKLHRAGDPGCFVAESASRPGLTHYVDVEVGCTCEGYAGYARCMHYSAAIAAMGWLPDWPDDDGPAAPPAAQRPRTPENTTAAGETPPTAADYEAAAARYRAEADEARRDASRTGWATHDVRERLQRAQEAEAAAAHAEWAARPSNQTAPWEQAQETTAAEQAHDDERERRSAAARKGAETRRRNRERAAAAAAEAERRTGIAVRKASELAAGERRAGYDAQRTGGGRWRWNWLAAPRGRSQPAAGRPGEMPARWLDLSELGTPGEQAA